MMKMKISPIFLSLFFLHFFIFANKTHPQKSYDLLINEKQQRIHPTHHITNIIRDENKLGLNEESLKELGLEIKNNKISGIINNYLDETYESQNFLFHYTLDNSNEDKISSDDINNNDIPDYIDKTSQVYEYVRDYYVEIMGFDPPVSDGNLGGSDKYDIYIENLPNNYWAITYTSDASTESNTSSSSFIKMRNNYNGNIFNNITELENIQITAAHEFFHAIQFSYNSYERFWIMEATATWAEDEIYDNVNDLYRYMSSWFQNPETPLDTETSHMYGSFIYFQYLDEHLGGASTIRKLWERSKINASTTTDNSFKIIDEVLQTQNSTFQKSLHSMRIANTLLTSDPLIGGDYTYSEAESFEVTKPPKKSSLFFNGNEPLLVTQTALKLNTSHYYSLNSNHPTQVTFNSQGNNNNDFNVSFIYKKESSNKWEIVNSYNVELFYNINWDNIEIVISSNNINKSNSNYSIEIKEGIVNDFYSSKIYPNPSYQDTDISIDVMSNINQIITFKIFNIKGQIINLSKINILLDDKHTFKWNGKSFNGTQCSNGVYFLTISNGSNITIEKMTLLK